MSDENAKSDAPQQWALTELQFRELQGYVQSIAVTYIGLRGGKMKDITGIMMSISASIAENFLHESGMHNEENLRQMSELFRANIEAVHQRRIAETPEPTN